MTMDEEITTLGKCNFRNQEVEFGIKTDDRRRHIYIIGKTGVGKTTLLENMIIDDIGTGRGVAFVDPHGDSAEKLLHLIPEERIDDTIYFNPADIEYPIAFNPLERVAEENYHLVASGIMAVFEKMWPDVWSARMQYILSNTLLALLEFPNATLLGIMRMLADKKYRKEVVENLRDPVVKSFWVNEFGQYTDRFATEAVAAIQNKVGQLVANPLIRNAIGQPHSSINLRKIMDEGKILIVNLSKGRIGEDNSKLLGGLVITRLQLAAMSRVDIPEEARRDFYLYIDEFQNFSTESFANILSEARKYRLSLTLAHQYIKQLVGEDTYVRDAIFGNVGTFVVFRVGAEDAEFLEPEFAPTFDQNDLVNLPKYHVYTRLMIDGVAGRAFSATTLPPYPAPKQSYADLIIENTRRRYAVPKEAVERKIASEWLTEEELMKEKVERRGERGLEVLERRRSEGERKKPRPDIDKDKLREALEGTGEAREKATLQKDIADEKPQENSPIILSENLTRNPRIDPKSFSDVNKQFLELLRQEGPMIEKHAENSEAFLGALEAAFDTSLMEFVGGEQWQENAIAWVGSFLGETLIKTLGGLWQWSPRQNRWVVILKSKEGDPVEANVFRKVENRMKNGQEDSLVYFYDMIKKIVEVGHEAILNPQSGQE